MKRYMNAVWVVLLLVGGCQPPARSAKPTVVVTIPPLAAIVREVAGDRMDVKCLLPPGASPHTYSARPSDVAAAESSAILFAVAPALDGWAANLPASKKVQILDMVEPGLLLPAGEDEHDGLGENDPHFWGDPLAVKSMLPGLVAALTEADPEGRATYEAAAKDFALKLDALDKELRATLKPVKGRAVVLFHRSLAYMLNRYGLVIAAVVEPSPGKEPTAKDLEALLRAVRDKGAVAAFTEPQLPRRPAEVLAESAHLVLGELDPEGGQPGRESYEQLMRHNAEVLVRCLSR